MIAIVTYDIVCNKRRSRLHRYLKEFGLNSQRSVFDCETDSESLSRMVAGARDYIDPAEDSLRVYRLCKGCQCKVAVSGLGIKLTPLDYMVI